MFRLARRQPEEPPRLASFQPELTMPRGAISFGYSSNASTLSFLKVPFRISEKTLTTIHESSKALVLFRAPAWEFPPVLPLPADSTYFPSC